MMMALALSLFGCQPAQDETTGVPGDLNDLAADSEAFLFLTTYSDWPYSFVAFTVKEFVAETLQTWTAMYIRKFQEVLDRYPPAREVTAKRLAEMFIAVIEGGLILERAHGNRGMSARQSEQFRHYLELLFPTAEGQEAA